MRFRSTLAVLGLLAGSFAAHADSYISYLATASVDVYHASTAESYIDNVTGTALYDVDTQVYTISLPLPVPVKFSDMATTDTLADCNNPYSGTDIYDCFSLARTLDFSFRYANPALYFYTPDGTTDFLWEEGGGQLTIATTPEPSSFALLGTGLLGVAGVIKRRFA